MNRRTFLRWAAASALVAGGGPLLYAGMIEPNTVDITRHDILVKGLGPGLEGLRVALISDLHAGMFTSRAMLSRVFDLLLAEQPDLILIAGDFLTEGGDMERGLDDLSATLGRLSAAAPVLAILGNHDHGLVESPLKAALSEQNIVMIDNAIWPIERDGDRLIVAGVGSISTGDFAMRNVVISTPVDVPAILMTHEPDLAQYSGPSGKYALHVAGHTHGGQIRLPWVGSLIRPWMGKLYPTGLYRIEDMWLYTSRGIGTVYLPFRFNCPPEITIFTLLAG